MYTPHRSPPDACTHSMAQHGTTRTHARTHAHADSSFRSSSGGRKVAACSLYQLDRSEHCTSCCRALCHQSWGKQYSPTLATEGAAQMTTNDLSSSWCQERPVVPNGTLALEVLPEPLKIGILIIFLFNTECCGLIPCIVPRQKRSQNPISAVEDLVKVKIHCNGRGAAGRAHARATAPGTDSVFRRGYREKHTCSIHFACTLCPAPVPFQVGGKLTIVVEQVRPVVSIDAAPQKRSCPVNAAGKRSRCFFVLFFVLFFVVDPGGKPKKRLLLLLSGIGLVKLSRGAVQPHPRLMRDTQIRTPNTANQKRRRQRIPCL